MSFELTGSLRGLRGLARTGFRRGLFTAGHRLRTELLGEALDAAFGVDQLLPAREERVTVRADFEMQLLLGRSRLPRRTAGAPCLDLIIFGMNGFLHDETPFKKTLIITLRTAVGKSYV